MSKEHLNYFSEKERKSITYLKNSRTKWLLPVSKFLNKLGLSADMVSYIGFLMIIGFVYFIKKDPIYASIFLFLHAIIDAFDGPLARLKGEDGDHGAFTDIICDHTGMIVATIALIFVNLVNPVIAATYIYLYTLMIIFTIVRNQLKIPAKLVIRTKYYVYILYGLWAFFGLNYLNEAIILFNILMLPSIFYGFSAIKNKLKGKK